MLARKKKYVARGYKSLRDTKAMPRQCVELTGSVKDLAKLLYEMGVKPCNVQVVVGGNDDNVLVVKGVSPKKFVKVPSDTVHVKEIKLGKPKSIGKYVFKYADADKIIG